eukprot:CAMPEP_0119331664 /NCGR_PEP_ID=MMETSP1333-20130426/81049_1 /TAXON_ID=418940 /ORGANISM="Scyphosphaera apsteinii, Strain RCC1455" /LENGTH=104 /DNA_ID=CAMNT_0007341323 /DNA_START=196 /DNA_END=510 /DNA_ORIENTATION=+
MASNEDAPRSIWSAMDDGRSTDELHAEADRLFQKLDLDGDGSVSIDEMRANLIGLGYKAELIEKVFTAVDTDNTGTISEDELRIAYVRYATLRTAPGLGGAVRE